MLIDNILYKENLTLLRLLFPGRAVITLNECAEALGVDYRTVKDLTMRSDCPLPYVTLSFSNKSRLGITLTALARWLTFQCDPLV